MKSSLIFRILAIVATVFVVLGVQTVLNANHDFDTALSNAKNSTRHQSKLYAEHAARSIDAVDLILLRIVDNQERDMTGKQRSLKTIQKSLKELTDRAPQIRALVIAGADGIQIASNIGTGNGKISINDRAYFNAHKANPNLGLLIDRPLRGKISGTWFLSITRSLQNPDGSFAGVVIAVVSQKYFNDFYETAETDEGMSTALMTLNGEVFAFSKAFAPNSRDIAGETMANSRWFLEHFKDNASGSFEGPIFKNDVNRIVAFQRVGEHPISTVTSINQEYAVMHATEHMTRNTLVIAAAGLIVLFLVIATIRQVKDREKIEEKLHHMANHDLLTDLPNRRQGVEYLTRAVASGRRHVTRVAVLFIDLDGFKGVNDNFGHDAGDTVLIDTARRFETCVRETDVVARIGGDEFLIVLTDITDDEATLRVAKLLIEAVGKPYEFYGQKSQLSASIGIAFFPHHGDSPESLINKADAAMYQAKQAGKNTYCVCE